MCKSFHWLIPANDVVYIAIDMLVGLPVGIILWTSDFVTPAVKNLQVGIPQGFVAVFLFSVGDVVSQETRPQGLPECV